VRIAWQVVGKESSKRVADQGARMALSGRERCRESSDASTDDEEVGRAGHGTIRSGGASCGE